MVLPKPAAPCLVVHRLTRSHPSGPLLAGPDHTCSRENSREGEPSVLPSAVLAMPSRPVRTMPKLSMPLRILPNPIYSPKRAAVGAEAPSAAVYSPCPTLPDMALPNIAQPRRTEPDATAPHLDS
jgi:hypothetical protein